jgi:hypothetical protein
LNFSIYHWQIFLHAFYMPYNFSSSPAKTNIEYSKAFDTILVTGDCTLDMLMTSKNTNKPHCTNDTSSYLTKTIYWLQIVTHWSLSFISIGWHRYEISVYMRIYDFNNLKMKYLFQAHALASARLITIFRFFFFNRIFVAKISWKLLINNII